MIKPEIASSRVAAACGDCGTVDRLLIHYVRHRGTFRRLCTSCVLRLHPQSFCPTCFQVYPPPPPTDAAVSCVKCYSSSHSHCIAAGPTPPPSPYVCPLCVSPNSPIFKLKTGKEDNLKTGVGVSEECRVMDSDSSKKFLAAARIASGSMNRAAVAAKDEADRRAKEAAMARKRAKEALEHIAYLVMKEKLRKKEAALAGSGVVAGLGIGGVGVGYAGSGFNMARVKTESNAAVGGNRNGIAGSCVSSSVIAEEKINAVGNVERVDSSNQVLAALNAVELRENGKAEGVTAQGMTAKDDQLVMDEDEKGRMTVNAEENGEEFTAERNDGSNDHDEIFAEMETEAENLDTQGTEQDDVSKEVVSVPTVADRIDCKENGNNGEQHGSEVIPRTLSK